MLESLKLRKLVFDSNPLNYLKIMTRSKLYFMRFTILLFTFLCLYSLNAYPQTYSYKAQFGSEGTDNDQFGSLLGLAINSDGDVLVGDINFTNNKDAVKIFTSEGVYKSQFGSYGSGEGQSYGLFAFAFAANGDIIAANTNNDRVEVLNSEGVFKSNFGGCCEGDGKMDFPNGVTVAPNGNIIVADSDNHRVQIFDSNGEYKSQFGGLGYGDGQMVGPRDVAVAPNGDLYVANRFGHKVQIFDSNGVYKSQIGGYGSGDGRFNQPTDVHFAANGDLLVVDANNDRVQVFNSNGVYKNQFGGFGFGDGEFDFPFRLAEASNGDIYVTDVSNHRVQIFAPFICDDFSVSTEAPSFCEGEDQVELTTTTTAVNPTYAWSDGVVADGSTATIFGPQGGSAYYVTVSDENGCSQTASVQLEANDSPVFDFENGTVSNASGNNVYTIEVCGGNLPYTLDFNSEGGFATINQLPSATANCQNIQVVYGNGVEWDITVESANGCSGEDSVLESDSENITDFVVSIDGFNLTNESGYNQADGAVTVNILGGNASCDEYTYDWSGPNTNLSNTGGVTDNTISGLAAGIYFVTVTDCTGNSQVGDTYVSRNTGRGRGRGGRKTANTGELALSLKVSPNPFAAQTNIAFSMIHSENVDIDVFGLSGQHIATIFEGRVEAGVLQNISFEADGLQTGTYLIRLMTESGVLQYQKVVLVR